MKSLAQLEGQARQAALEELEAREASEQAWLMEYTVVEAEVLDRVVASIAAEHAMADSDLREHGAVDIGDARNGDRWWNEVAGRKWPWSATYTLRLPRHESIEREYRLTDDHGIALYASEQGWYVGGGGYSTLAAALHDAACAFQEMERERLYETEWEARVAHGRAERKQQQADERQALLDALEGDRIAIAMVRVFAAIQNERDGWEDGNG
jgi:hypothetical protein